MASRREFLKTMMMASAGLAVGTPSLLYGQEAKNAKPKGEKVKIAYIGIGNRGRQIIEAFAKTGMVEVVALCDVDMGAKHTQKVMAMYPKAKLFRDFRKLFDEAGNLFDAVAIATPDHSHFPISMLALASGKHVYVEKPLARTFYEAELLMEAARKRPNLATQVGNQGHSEANYFQFKAWMDAGIIKDVTAVTAHMNNARRWHKWDSNIHRFPTGQQLPPDRIGTRGSALPNTTTTTPTTIWDSGVAGTTSVWVHWAIGVLTCWTRYTNSSNWDSPTRFRCSTPTATTTTSSPTHRRFSSASRSVRACRP